jgi:phosphoribosylformylglycinamidine cyclo-ligase
MSNSKTSEKYVQRGVSASKEDVHNAIKNLDKGLFPKAFCKIVPDFLTGSEDHCIIMHADGAGTKSSLAYMYWKETGDLSVWKGIAQDALIMNIDDLICVGATKNIMLSSTIGRNRNKISGDVISAIINGTQELIDDLKKFDIMIHMTGGETADVGDLVRTIIVDSTVLARIKKEEVIDNSKICNGNVIVGLASYGKSSYETNYNSGMGSNGLTSARHDIFSKVIKKIISSIGNKNINGIIHCSGGAQTKILHFINDNLHVIKDNMFDIPFLFRLIQQESNTDWAEMYKVFNCGHRMELYVEPQFADEIIKISNSFNIEAKIIGKVVSSDEKKLTVKSEFGEFNY